MTTPHPDQPAEGPDVTSPAEDPDTSAEPSNPDKTGATIDSTTAPADDAAAEPSAQDPLD